MPSGAARAAPGVPPVETALAGHGAIGHEITVTGSVVSPRVSRISAEVAGQVARMHVEIGDRVAAGAPLVALDAELSEIALAGARAGVREARAALAEAERRLAEAERLSAERTIAETELRARAAAVELAAAALARAETAERREAALLARHTVSAPYAGAVSRKLTNAGEWVDRGTAVVELVATDALRVDFQVPQEFFPRVEQGLALDISLDALPQPLAARVVGVVPVSAGQSRTFTLMTRPEDAGAPIIPGMSARARLHLHAGRAGVTVPRDALLRHPDGRVTLWVVERDGAQVRVGERRIRPGRAFGERIEIVDGLAAGTEIVVRGNEGLAEGQHVRVGAPP